MDNENENDQRVLEQSYAKDQTDPLFKWIRDGTRGAQGMSLNVQVIGKPWCEEMVLRVMKEIEDSVDI